MDNFELYYRLNKDGSSEKITGVPPLSFVSNGENLSDCKIYGNTVSEESVGELVTEGGALRAILYPDSRSREKFV